MFTPICVMLTECVEHIEAVRNKLDLDEIPTINKKIVASDIARGEITFPLIVALNSALQHKAYTAIIDSYANSFESTMILISHLSAIPFEVLKSGTLLDDDWDKLMPALEQLNDAPIFMVHKNPTSIEKLIRTLKGMHISKKLDLVVVNELKIAEEHQAEVLNHKDHMVKLCQFAVDSKIDFFMANQAVSY